MPLDVAAVRARFPALAEGLVHLDGPGGTQTADTVAEAVSGALRAAVSNRGGAFASSRRAEEIVVAARAAVADLLGAEAAGVVFGPNMTTLTFALSRTLGRTWRPGDEVVVSRLDHDANVRPWVIAAADAGAVVRWADVDVDTGELPVAQYADLVNERTRLVAVTAASNALGTVPDVRAIADVAHAAGALVHVDGVHATAHLPVDVVALGADFYACSSYKFFGPHVGMTVAAPALWDSLRPDKLLPSPEAVPSRFETGTMQFELLAGVTACVELLASLSPVDGARRDRVLGGLAEVEAHEQELLARLLAGVAEVPGVRVLGRPARRTPTVALVVDGRTPSEVATELGEAGICVWSGDYYAAELMRALGRDTTGGAVRVGLAPYTTADEVDRFVDALAKSAS